MSSTISITDQFKLERGGQAECGWIQNHCTKCGWSGEKHYAYNDYQHTNCKEERAAHKCEQNLPRNQHCVANVTAEVVGDE